MTKLSKIDTLTTGDSIVVLSAADNEYRAISVTNFISYMNANLSAPAQPVFQYEAPNASGFSVTINNKNTWLVLTPVGAYAAGTVVLPSNPTALLQVTITTTQTVTTLTLDGQGANVPTATSLTAGEPLTVSYEPVLNTWYKVA